tara:strand:+ start:782 stop:940 length:159 start_codon:yes stop_codon:yes gene_type:complete
MTTITQKPQDVKTKTKNKKTYAYEQVLEAAVAYFNGDRVSGYDLDEQVCNEE